MVVNVKSRLRILVVDNHTEVLSRSKPGWRMRRISGLRGRVNFGIGSLCDGLPARCTLD